MTCGAPGACGAVAAAALHERRFAFDPRPIEDLEGYLERVSGQWDEALGRLKTFVER